jgi:hypothetical protein
VAFSRRRKETYRPPPPPPPELVEAIRESEITAETQLDDAHARDNEVEEQTRRTREIRRKNALGMRFWEAVGERRST